VSTIWSTRHNNQPRLLPFDKERIARRRARWERVGRIVALVLAGVGLVVTIILLLVLSLVGTRE
jgi:type VI protein secretion system component VasF